MIPKSLLVVGQNETDSESLRQTLCSKDSLSTRLAADAESAHEMVRQSMPDVILVDVRVGAQVIERLRRMGQGVLPCAVVVLVGSDSEERAIEAIGLGAHDYLTTQRLEQAVLWEVVRVAHARSRVERQARDRERYLKRLDQELTAKERLKTQFVANASHELRTPVAAITGLVNLLHETTLNSDQQGLVANIEACCGSLLSVVDDLIDMAKIEAGTFEPFEVPFQVRETVQAVHHSVEILAREKGLELHFDVDSQCPEWLLGDPRRLRQIVQNFVSNAIKFTAQGSVVTRVNCPRPGALHVSVTDTGSGLTSEECRRVFDPHFQGATPAYGKGLGLSIVRSIVSHSNGSFGVDSTPGTGSCFWVQLPVRLQDERLPGAVDGPAERTYKLLVAEDNPIVARVLALQLEQLGHSVAHAEDGLQTLALLADSEVTFDAILMDCQMPNVDGFEATRRIRNNRHWQNIPIIALTANALVGEADRCHRAGMNDFMVKPVALDELQRLLEHWVDNSCPLGASRTESEVAKETA